MITNSNQEPLLRIHAIHGCQFSLKSVNYCNYWDSLNHCNYKMTVYLPCILRVFMIYPTKWLFLDFMYSKHSWKWGKKSLLNLTEIICEMPFLPPLVKSFNIFCHGKKQCLLFQMKWLCGWNSFSMWHNSRLFSKSWIYQIDNLTKLKYFDVFITLIVRCVGEAN